MNTVFLISIILLIIMSLVLFIDFIPYARDWLGRIHIGRYSNKDHWNNSITKQGTKWLNKTPKIRVTDNNRLLLIDMIKGNYSNNDLQYWQEASLLLGLVEKLSYKNEDYIKDEINKFLLRKFDSNGNWKVKPKNIDVGILAYALMQVKFIEIQKYKPALDYTWELIKEHIGEDGTVGYRKSMMDYRYVDTIGFICPFLISYGKYFDNNNCIELSIKQIESYKKYGMLSGTSIPYHAYKIHSYNPLGLCGWGRGLGWFGIGLIDAWKELEPGTDKKFLEGIIKEFVCDMQKCQRENGSWNWTVFREESRPDSSATATLGWVMLNASVLDDIKKLSLFSANRAAEYLMSVTRRDGSIDFSQGDTKDIGVYSLLYNLLPFTQGFSIRLINKYYQIKADKFYS
ncbi:glycoside hydrolase family 88 protein [Robertmurraya sp. FSL R5-0851]|uniref:glycoside hydrolase family 88 protein n=1 Tax=Robertmurraya sp. FSL R5-0851 TaxID=2921584 RepID=UPI0030F6A430